MRDLSMDEGGDVGNFGAAGGDGDSGWYAQERFPPSFPSFPPRSAKRRLCQSENPLFLFMGRLAQLVERLVYTE